MFSGSWCETLICWWLWFWMTLPSVRPLPAEHRHCSLAPARTHEFFGFSGNAVWHYKELYSRATEQPVKDIHGETRRLRCHLQLLVAFQSLRSVRYDLTLFRNMTLVRMSIQVTCNTQFPIIKFFFCSIEEWESCLSEKDTLSLRQRACSSMTISVQGKAVFDRSPLASLQ